MTSGIRPADYLLLKALLRDHLGHDLGEGKEYLLEGRLGPVATAFGLADIAALAHRLRSGADPALREAVLEALAIGETSFFRAGRAFERLRDVAIPTLMVARAASRRLRIWCAACSTGQEAYSIAILLADAFPALAGWRVEILATDSSERSLRRAREGIYTQAEVGRGMPESALRRHFRAVPGGWQVSDAIRRGIEFRRFNLLQPFLGLGDPFDIILARNVLIYLEKGYKSAVLAKFRAVIRDDGFLFLGESETILGLTDLFTFPLGDDPFFAPARDADPPPR
jgi:chemotaxis protein methyltransferase CheR